MRVYLVANIHVRVGEQTRQDHDHVVRVLPCLPTMWSITIQCQLTILIMKQLDSLCGVKSDYRMKHETGWMVMETPVYSSMHAAVYLPSSLRTAELAPSQCVSRVCTTVYLSTDSSTEPL